MIYEPREDSFLLSRNLKKYVKGKSVLDMGAGSGIQAETAINAGAKSVLAVDIDNDALKYLKNKFKNTKRVRIVKSNLFSKINKNKKFDVIVFNPPYLPRDKREDRDSAKATTGGKRGDEISIKFLRQAPGYLEKRGVILLILSSLTPHDSLLKVVKGLGFNAKIIDQEKMFMETLEVWLIREAQ